jgi:carboxylesterase type B
LAIEFCIHKLNRSSLNHQMKADQSFWHGMHRLIRSRRHSGGSGRTFLYRFAVDSPTQNHYRNVRLGPGVKGVCHSDELSYLFKNKFVEHPTNDSMEFQAIQRFVSFCLWRNFKYSRIQASHSHRSLCSLLLQRVGIPTITLSTLT